jgi:hypothetical protein
LSIGLLAVLVAALGLPVEMLAAMINAGLISNVVASAVLHPADTSNPNATKKKRHRPFSKGYNLVAPRVAADQPWDQSSCSNATRLLGAVISQGGSRFARARAVLHRAGFEALHFPAVFVTPRSPCEGYNGLRVASRNVWKTIARTNTSMAVFEDDIILHSSFARWDPERVAQHICTYIRSTAPSADVIYLGHLDAGNVKWGTHAMWISPAAARVILANTADCYTIRGDGTDSHVVAACRTRFLTCRYAHPKYQKPEFLGGAKHGFRGYFIQDRVNVSSYLHSAKGNAGHSPHAVKPKSVWE